MRGMIIAMFVCALAFFCLAACPVYAQEVTGVSVVQTKTVDINKDGKPDVTYYSDGKYATKVEADTNYDGKPDIVVQTKDGKFESAQADTDYNGTMDKKFTNAGEFNQWLKKNHPDLNDKLNRSNWEFAAIKF